MWLNESEVEQAQEWYADHPVLAPATATLAALVEWTDAHSDGWAYWPKPAKAAAQLMELIGTMRDYIDHPAREDATPERYKAALVPLKSFRTRMGKTPIGTGADFPIHEPLPVGKSVRTFTAELALSQAEDMHRAAQAHEQAALQLRRLAGTELAESRQVDNANVVLSTMKADPDASARLVMLAEPGRRVWLLPEFTDGKYSGLGHLATSLGMTGPTERHLVVVKDDEHGGPHNWLRLYPYVVLLPGEAAAKWWVVDGAGNLVTGGHDDRERMLELAGKQAVPCKVVQGAEFVPDAIGVLVPGEECGECQARIPGAEAAEVNAHHWPTCSLHPGAVVTAHVEG